MTQTQQERKYFTYNSHKHKTFMLTKEEARGSRVVANWTKEQKAELLKRRRKVMTKAEREQHPEIKFELEPDQRKWFIVDAAGVTLGRLATRVALHLRGKHRPDFTPYIDSGDGIIVINADKVHVTGSASGSKMARKLYRKHTGFVGGLREVPMAIMMGRNPEYVLEHAILGMLPKSRLGDQQSRKLRVFKSYEAGKEPAELRLLMKSQKPTPIQL
jgi:large subunit ribosomal protein L13